jgi:ribulose bisphosphate carboxylase small subunit
MGANLVPIVRNFGISVGEADSHSIADGCIVPGIHRVLRFDFHSRNVGDADFLIGKPVLRPELFVKASSPDHDHFHLRHFNEFRLLDLAGREMVPGFKQAFCVEDLNRWDPDAGAAKFLCDAAGLADQGISPGWEDIYSSTLSCQYIVIDGVPDGVYQLVATTNVLRIVAEDSFDDNTVRVGLRIRGNVVAEVLLEEIVARHNLTSGQHQQAVNGLLAQGFRPTWLSGYTVGGQDRYASIWEKRPGPELVTRHNLTSAQHQQLVTDLFARGFRPTGVSGYTVDGQDRFASIWERRPGPELVARHNLTSAQHQQLVTDLLARGFRPTCISGYAVDGQDRFASIWEKRPGPELVARHNLTSAQHQQLVTDLLAQGFRPTCISGYAIDGQDRFASIWEKRPGPELVARHNLTSAQHQQLVTDLFAQGFRPTCVSGYAVDGQDRFASIWEKRIGPDFYASLWVKTSGPELLARHNLTSAEHQQLVDDLLVEGFRPTWVNGYTVTGQDRYASIWEKRPGPELVARHNLTSAQHQQLVTDLLAQGFRPTCLSGYAVDGLDRYASIWEKRPGPELVARHNLTSAQHQQLVTDLLAQGFRPTCVNAYVVDGQDRYASIWEKRPGPELVARHNLTSAQHQQLVTDLLARGFRPTCVSGYVVDGQDRFASIWEQSPGAELVARHNLTSAQHQQLASDLFAQGFRPVCVSGYSLR